MSGPLPHAADGTPSFWNELCVLGRRAIRAFKVGFDRYRFFWITLVTGVLVFAFVPQVRNLWAQLPPYGTGFEYMCAYYFLLMALVSYFAVSPIVVMQRFPIRWISDWAIREVEVWRRTTGAEIRAAMRNEAWTSNKKLQAPARWVLGAVLQVLVMLAWLPDAVSRLLGLALTERAPPVAATGAAAVPVAITDGAITDGAITDATIADAAVTDHEVMPPRAAANARVMGVALLAILAAVGLGYYIRSFDAETHPFISGLAHALATLVAFFTLVLLAAGLHALATHLDPARWQGLAGIDDDDDETLVEGEAAAIERPRRRLQSWVGMPMLLLVGSVAGLLLLLGPATDSSRMYPLAGAASRNFGWLLALLALWILAYGRGPQPRLLFSLALVQLRVLSWLLFTAVFSEILWIAATVPGVNVVLSYRLYAVHAVSMALVTLVLVAALIDYWHEVTDWPLRLLALIAVPLVMWMWGGAALVEPSDFTRDLTLTERREAKVEAPIDRAVVSKQVQLRHQQWFDQLEARLAEVGRGEGPVVLVAASGGGSRAAIFTALALETLARTPLEPDQPMIEVARHEVDRKGTLSAGIVGASHLGAAGGLATVAALGGIVQRTWGDQILLVSSVSGGSLATAHYVHDLRPEGIPLIELDRLVHTSKAELAENIRTVTRQRLKIFLDNNPRFQVERDQLTAAELPAFLAAKTKEFRAAKAKAAAADAAADAPTRAAWQEDADAWRQLLGLLQTLEYCGALQAAMAGNTPAPPPGRFAWTLKSARFDAMCTDFMAPVLRATLTPELDRGDALARFWTAHFGWHNATSFHGYDRDKAVRNWTYQPCHPVILFNASDVTQGARLAIGFPPLPHDLLGRTHPQDSPRPRSLSDFSPHLQLSLARAVRMSSNFPWGFRVMAIATDDLKEPYRHILDGGVVDNTGIDTIYELLNALDDLARNRKPDVKPGDPSLRAASILKTLRRRGVIVFEIDSGAKPDRNRAGGPLAALTEPTQALTNAAFTNAEQVKDFYVKQIERILTLQAEDVIPADLPKEYRDFLPRAFGTSVRHVRFQCNHYTQDRPNDVMTAWTLGPADKAEVVGRFLVELYAWDERRPEWHLQALRQQARDVAASAEVARAFLLFDDAMVKFLQRLPELKKLAESKGLALKDLDPARTLLRDFDDLSGRLQRHPLKPLEPKMAAHRAHVGVVRKLLAEADKPKLAGAEKPDAIKSAVVVLESLQKMLAAEPPPPPLTTELFRSALMPANFHAKTISQEVLDRSALHDRVNSQSKK